MAQNSNYRAAIIYEKFSDTPVVMDGGKGKAHYCSVHFD